MQSMRDFRNLRSLRYKNTRRGRKKLFPNLIVIFFTVVVIGFLATVGIFAWYAKDLPNPAKVQRKEGFSTIIYDRSGELLYDIFADQNRIPVDIEDTPRDLKNATVAIEDRDFYKHEGYSTRGMIRAFLQILIFRNLQGGSTLTQQLVKNVLLTSERTLPRKIKEFILAVQIEQKYSKDEILQMYLNEAPYGGTAWGVAAGAQYYFGKETKDLNLVESAILAGFPQRPSVYSPFSSEPKAYIARTENVLRRMRENGYINKNEEEKAKEELESIKFKNKEENFKAPHFVMYVKKELEEKLGQEMVSGGGLKVTTTLNLKLQEKAEEILRELGGFSEEEIKEIVRLVLVHDNLWEMPNKEFTADGFNDFMVIEADSLSMIDPALPQNFSPADKRKFIEEEFVPQRLPLFRSEFGQAKVQELLQAANEQLERRFKEEE